MITMAENTRSQELKRIEDNLKSMVKGLIAEQGKKTEASFAEVNQRQDSLQEQIASSQAILIEEMRKIVAVASTSNPPKTNHQVNLSNGNHEFDYHLAPRFTKIEFPKFEGDDLEGWFSNVSDFLR